MTLIQAILLGVVQGITEFLPISSSGHLAVLKYLFGMKDVGLTFDIFLHVGTLIAIVAVYYKDVWLLIKNACILIAALVRNLVIAVRKIFDREAEDLEFQKVADTPYKRFVWLIVVSCIPLGVIGFLCADYIEMISKGLFIPGICFLITGVILLLGESFPVGNTDMENMSFGSAVVIGIAQALSIFPGISRSGTTVSAGLMCGLDREFAVKYSFILSIPAVIGAALKSVIGISGKSAALGGQGLYYLAGMAAAAIVGFFAIKLLQVIVRKRGFKYFSIYCFVIGIASIVGFICTR